MQSHLCINNNITYDNGMLGTWTDQQIPNTYSHYADPVMETLLVKDVTCYAKETGLQFNTNIFIC